MFPGADADRDAADYVVVGAPLDVSTTFQPGARFGPERIRRFARTFDDYDRRTDAFFTDLAVHDYGDVDAWDDAVEYLEHLENVLGGVVGDGAVPLLLGGEHTVTVAGVRAVEPDVYVCLDAHLDLRVDYDGNRWSHATVTRHLLDGSPPPECDDLGGGPVEEAIILGARTGSEEEWERVENGEDVTVVPPEQVAEWEPPSRLSEKSVYLSVDVDGADPGFVPGTGTMEPFGLEPREMRAVVRSVTRRCEVGGFDVVEVNDRDEGEAAALGGKLVREFVYGDAGEDS